MKKTKSIFLVFTLLLVTVLTGCGAKEDAAPAVTANPTVPSVTVPSVTIPPAAATPVPVITPAPIVPTAAPTAEATTPAGA